MVHDVDGIDVNGRGRGIRYDTGRFPQGTNVNFVEVTGNGAIRMRTYERGVEHETLACGTGSCAVLVAANLCGLAGREAEIELDGGTLLDRWDEQTGHVLMTGPAAFVFDGEYEA